ncbi:MAG TPA: rod shape-determining protein RodA [Micropepsaceae bacterium]|nr:rod shape-determining protein RodA [Micropepsaceae bacterium]
MSVHSYDDRRRPASLSHKLSEVNWRLVALITVIACAGFVMLYSAAGGSFSPWAERQMVRFVIGFFILVAVACVDLRVWMGLAYPAYAVSLLLLVAVEVAGRVGLGAQRWIELGPLALQPSELMKIALVLALARYLHGLVPGEVSKPFRLFVPLAMIAVPVVLVLMQPNLGTATLLALCGALLLFLAGLSWYWIAPTLTAVALAVPMAWQFALHDYQKQRVMTFLDPHTDALGAGWNITQAKIALGSGGIIGKGFLLGTQSRLNFLPEKETDFIFTMIGEEFGFLGSMALLAMFALVLYYGIQIAMKARSQFGRLLAMGITVNFFLYIMINGLMVMGLIPVVGIPMPLISYGGSAMMTVMFGFGLLMSVHVHRGVAVPKRSSGMI